MSAARRRSALLFAVCALLASVCWFAPLAHAQSRIPDADDMTALQVAHREALQVERERALLEAWNGASKEQRVELERIVREGRDARRSSLSPLDLRSIARGLRNLRAPERADELWIWYDLLDALDLRLRPGVFEARSEGRGEPLTVDIDSLWGHRFAADPDREMQAHLIWLAPGGVEQNARSEPVTARSLMEGFQMFIRPPISVAQTWQLVLEVETPSGSLRGIPVPVECVEGLAQERARVGARPAGTSASGAEPNEPLRQRILARLELLTRFGIRAGGGVPLANWFAGYAASASEPRVWPTQMRVLPIDGGQLGVPGETFWQLREESTSERVLLLLADLRESPTDLLSGPRGEAWNEFARVSGTRVVAGHLPLTATDMGPLVAVVRALRADSPEARVWVLARGDSGRLLPRLLAQQALPQLDGLILSETIAAGAALSAQLSVPALRVQLDVVPAKVGVQEIDGGRARRTHVALPSIGTLAFPQAQDAIRTWIESL